MSWAWALILQEAASSNFSVLALMPPLARYKLFEAFGDPQGAVIWMANFAGAAVGIAEAATL
jgi:hypothetical protein